jgi:hypothetical protein
VKKALVTLILLILCVPAALGALQDSPLPRAEITGVDPSGLPEVIVTANVYDPVNQPLLGLGEGDFEIVGPLAQNAQVVSVQNIADDELPFSTVLVIDVSSSMEGLPITRARAAATLYVDSVGPNDPIAIYTFSDDFELVQPFTTDKDALRTAIAGLRVGGPTGLYQAAYNAVGLAASAPTNRRTVILLSDGAEYGGASSVGRGAALQEAQLQGVPIYTIGLGYGIDRSYLEELAEGINARFYESPDPEQLTQIYGDLATLLTSQYVITLDVDVPADGTEYPLALQVNTPFGIATTDDVTLRAPIPVPIVTAPVFDVAITEPTEITPTFSADQDIAEAAFSIDGGEVTTVSEAPYGFMIDPVMLSPGTHELEISVTDVDGDTGSVTASFEVGALPPEVNVVSNLAQTVENTQTVQVDIGGQTPGVRATFQVDGQRVITDNEAPFSFDVDPLVLPPGAHTLTITATNEGGETTTVEVPFTVANIGPYVVIVGVAEGDVIDSVTPLEVDIIVTQSPVTSVEMRINGQLLEDREIPPGSVILSTSSLDPMQFAPGDATLTVRAINETGGVSENSVSFTIAALPPVVVFENLADGDTIEANQDAVINFISQTRVSSVDYTLDGVALDTQTSAPWDIPLDVLALGPGSHTLTVTPTTSNGQTTTATLNFVVSAAPAQTATAQLQATQTVIAGVTQDAQSTRAASTQFAIQATATQQAVAATGTAVFGATGTAQAEAEAAAQASDATATQVALQAARTEVAAATSEARAIAQQTTATAEAGARATQAATEATATQAAQATASAEVQQQADTSATAQSELEATQTATDATATTAAQATATARSGATATQNARDALTQTATAEALATETQQAMAIAQAATSTVDAQATATQNAQRQQTLTAEAAQTRQTATAEARASATQAAQAQLTATAQAEASATRDAQNALLTQTAEARQATQDARATATQEIIDATETRDAADAQTTRVAQLAATATQDAAERADALTATASSREAATAQAVNATATESAQVTATAQTAASIQSTADAGATESADATQAASTASAGATSQAAQQATENAQATADAQATATASVTEEPTTVPPTEEPTLPATPTPRGTLVPIEAESQTADVNQLIPILVIIVAAVIVLFVIYLILRGGRSRR